MNTTGQTQGVNICITGSLARVVGCVAAEHPDFSIEIRWLDGSDERDWYVIASNGREDVVYVADDEAGTWAPAMREETDRLDAAK